MLEFRASPKGEAAWTSISLYLPAGWWRPRRPANSTQVFERCATSSPSDRASRGGVSMSSRSHSGYPDQTALDTMPESGAALWVAGAVQPRFWSGETDKRSRLEIVAHQVEVRRDAAPAPENHH